MTDEETLPLFQVDAFTDVPFSGNPAAVCLYERWLSDEAMQRIADENNLSETAFLVPLGEEWELRWFTPVTEVDLCGHATLAAACVLFREVQPEREDVVFQTRSGALRVRDADPWLVLDFPARPARPVSVVPPALVRGLGRAPAELLEAKHNLLAVFDAEAHVAALDPNMDALLELEGRSVIATAPGDEVDFVSRYFAPAVGVPEDPVTGSAHCTLTPYWSRRLDKKRLEARQISRRGGFLRCTDRGERVALAGQAVIVLRGEMTLAS